MSNSGHIGSLGLAQVRQRIEAAVDAAKTRAGDVDVLLVGGGSVVVPLAAGLRGVRSIRRPKHFEVRPDFSMDFWRPSRQPRCYTTAFLWVSCTLEDCVSLITKSAAKANDENQS